MRMRACAHARMRAKGHSVCAQRLRMLLALNVRAFRLCSLVRNVCAFRVCANRPANNAVARIRLA